MKKKILIQKTAPTKLLRALRDWQQDAMASLEDLTRFAEPHPDVKGADPQRRCNYCLAIDDARRLLDRGQFLNLLK